MCFACKIEIIQPNLGVPLLQQKVYFTQQQEKTQNIFIQVTH